MKQEDNRPLFSLTVPPAGRNGPRPMAGPSDSELLNDVARIRRVLARELETINEYEAFAQASSSPEVRAFFAHLATEEKEHVAEATQMLRLLDSGQDAHFAKPHRRRPLPDGCAGPGVRGPAAAPRPGQRRPRGSSRISVLPPSRVIYSLTAPPPPRTPPAHRGLAQASGRQ